MHPSRMDLCHPFYTDIFFINDLFDSASPAYIARTLTDSDLQTFARLSVQNIIGEDMVFQQYLTRWDLLSRSVWECCSAFPDLIESIRECLQVSIF